MVIHHLVKVQFLKVDVSVLFNEFVGFGEFQSRFQLLGVLSHHWMTHGFSLGDRPLLLIARFRLFLSETELICIVIQFGGDRTDN